MLVEQTLGVLHELFGTRVEGPALRRHPDPTWAPLEQRIAEDGLEVVETLGYGRRAQVEASCGARQALLVGGEQERAQLCDLGKAFQG
jgi:hypothetical protein